MPVKMITLWYKYTDKGNKVAVFNHIENGHVDGEFPKPKDKSYTNQKAWEKSEWKNSLLILISNIRFGTLRLHFGLNKRSI
ncbi:hypothetical protein [Bacillus altitudinis]|uniref:hypothetical protein n=1 Tax=Bacillus altitudinis TaxID=293387 RepID=UPI000A494590|nr:hypothetical protein [Bacillus altitudinis]